ncbi:hypothetical protein FOL46_005631 [Perkinsus olseni]|uniref:Methyltransferase domain-containing protein n=1 Tax=Perkinsus olseni TaxID=32597 RepID=A0A7J6LR72_PEROL|nr:hypothetical protein FOL46_005631 [Perkinsus olseni]
MKLCGRLGCWLVARVPDLIAHTDRLAEHGYSTRVRHNRYLVGIFMVGALMLLIFTLRAARVSLPERNSTSRGVCRFTDFSSACSECSFAVEIMTTDWTYQFVGYQMEFAYSRIEEYWYPKEEPFRCCPTRETFDCCNFYSDANQTFCDAWSCPESPNEDPWECTFPRVGTSGEDITWISIGSKNEVTRDLTLAGLGGLLILLALSWKYNRILRKVFWRIFGSCIRAVERKIKSVYARLSVSWFGTLLRRVKLLVILVWECGGYDDEDAAEGSEDATADQKGQANSVHMMDEDKEGERDHDPMARALRGEKSTEASNASGDVSPLVEPIERSIIHRLRDAAGQVSNGLGGWESSEYTDRDYPRSRNPHLAALGRAALNPARGLSSSSSRLSASTASTATVSPTSDYIDGTYEQAHHREKDHNGEATLFYSEVHLRHSAAGRAATVLNRLKTSGAPSSERTTPRLDRIARDATHREELRQYESKLRLNRRMDESTKKEVTAVKALYRKEPGMVLLGGPTTMAVNSAISNLNGFSKWTTQKDKPQRRDHGPRSVRRDIEKRAKAWPKTPLLRWLEGVVSEQLRSFPLVQLLFGSRPKALALHRMLHQKHLYIPPVDRRVPTANEKAFGKYYMSTYHPTLACPLQERLGGTSVSMVLCDPRLAFDPGRGDCRVRSYVRNDETAPEELFSAERALHQMNRNCIFETDHPRREAYQAAVHGEHQLTLLRIDTDRGGSLPNAALEEVRRAEQVVVLLRWPMDDYTAARKQFDFLDWMAQNDFVVFSKEQEFYPDFEGKRSLAVRMSWIRMPAEFGSPCKGSARSLVPEPLSRSQTRMSDILPSARSRQFVGPRRNRPDKWFARNTFPEVSCEFEERLGTRGDGGKWVCESYKLGREFRREPVIIYSVGYGNSFSFEAAFHDEVNDNAEIFVFEIDRELYEKAVRVGPAFITWKHWGLASRDDRAKEHFTLPTMRRMLGHADRVIDIFKIDCEGCEFDTFRTWFDVKNDKSLPTQILIEVHWRDPKSARSLLEYLMELDYIIFRREPNYLAKSSYMEFGLVQRSFID